MTPADLEAQRQVSAFGNANGESRGANRPMTVCRLCEEERELVESHLVPKFVFRWLRQSSQTGVRQTSQPNRRVQDGWKRPFLCAHCEERLNRFETPFASHLFVPFHKQDPTARAATFSYGSWALPFCVSVSWRALRAAMEDGSVPPMSAEQTTATKSALHAWRGLLLGRREHPGEHAQYIYPLGLIKNAPDLQLSAYQSRYFLRTIQIDVLVGSNQLVVFSKLGRLLLIGFVIPPDRRWRGWKIHVRKGVLPIQSLSMPHQVMSFLADSADEYASSYTRMSARQQQLASSGVSRSTEEEDEAFVAFRADVALFGSAAVRERGSSQE